MRKIFDEYARVKEIKENGFKINSAIEYVVGTNSTEVIEHGNNGDVYLFARYLREQGYTEKPMVEEIMEYAIYDDDSFDWHECRRFVRKACKSVCAKFKKGDKSLVDIDKIYISQSAKDYFMGLVGKEVVSQNGIDRGIKKLGVKEVRTLFVLYCWTLIQKKYMDEYWKYINIDNCKRAFQRSCGNTWAECWKSICVLYDMGLIQLTNSYLSLTMVVDLGLDDDEEVELDKLYELGSYIDLWLGKKAICPNCGEFFVKKARTSRECCENCRREKNKEKLRKYRLTNKK